MTIRYGSGESPEIYALRLTVEAPDGTTPAAPVEIGSIYKLGGTDADGGGYKLVAAVDNDDVNSAVLVRAEQRAIGVDPMTVVVLGHWNKVLRLAYLTGSAPSLGQSVQISSTVTKVDGKAFDESSFVLHVDTALEEVEVLC
jgi:hypothetical protein